MRLRTKDLKAKLVKDKVVKCPWPLALGFGSLGVRHFGAPLKKMPAIAKNPPLHSSLTLPCWMFT